MKRQSFASRLRFLATLGATCGTAIFLTSNIVGALTWRPGPCFLWIHGSMATVFWLTSGFMAELGGYLFGGDVFRILALLVVYWALLGVLVVVPLGLGISKWRRRGDDGPSDEPLRTVERPRRGALFAIMKTNRAGIVLVITGFLTPIVPELCDQFLTLFTGASFLTWIVETLIAVTGLFMMMVGVLLLSKSIGTRFQLAVGLTMAYVLAIAAVALVGVLINGSPGAHVY